MKTKIEPTQEKKPMQWSDFTNKFLGAAGKFGLLPLIIIGVVLFFAVDALVGVIVIIGACFLFFLLTLGIVIFKPLLLKKFPEEESKALEKPVPDEVLEKMTPEERRKIPHKSSGQFIVDKAEPYEQMNKLHKLAVDQFDGDLEMAMDYIFSNLPVEEQGVYAENLSDKDMEAFRRLIFTVARNRTTEKEQKRIFDNSFRLSLLEMTEEEVLSAPNNPFGRKLLVIPCAFAGGAITAGVLLGLAEWGIMDEDTAIGLCVLAACAVGLVLLCMIHVICSYFRFRKVKRALMEERKGQESAEKN